MNLQPLHALVWSYRNDPELAAVWPTPPPDVALAFAFTEAGEAVDAWLRTDPRWTRNNHKAHDESDEWADCLMMLATAAPRYMGAHVLPMICTTRMEMAHHVSMAAKAAARKRPCRVLIFNAAATIVDQMGGMDVALALVRARLDRIRAKHLGQQDGAGSQPVPHRQTPCTCDTIDTERAREGSMEADSWTADSGG